MKKGITDSLVYDLEDSDTLFWIRVHYKSTRRKLEKLGEEWEK